MDRFIDENNILNIPLTKTFKIQYGQIYSVDEDSGNYALIAFKIQYGQIYSYQVP